MKDFITREYRTIRSVAGPLIFIEEVGQVSLGEMVNIVLPSGEARRGEVIESSEKFSVIQVFEDTKGIGSRDTRIQFLETGVRMGLSPDMLGRRFNGAGIPADGLPPLIPREFRDIQGSPINPVARDKPEDFIQTGISAIDGLNTLVRGQKLPIFSGAGLPAHEVAARILRQARVAGELRLPRREAGDPVGFAVVFGALGITFREANYFMEVFEESGVLEHSVAFLNLADDPTIERLLTPRFALTAAEYLAFTMNRHVLVILTDMTNYCEALREVATSREEMPGRRGFPGYMYTDLATIYERAGRIFGKAGSVTQLPILTMPDDDITHPIPDLTGYITEGQVVLSREMHRKGVFPPIDVLPSLSRLMNLGIGTDKTREDHRGLADQLYAFYARGRDLRQLAAIVGEEGLGEDDRIYLHFSETFEKEFVHQDPSENRSLQETLTLGWKLLGRFPREKLTRIDPGLVRKFYPGRPEESREVIHG